MDLNSAHIVQQLTALLYNSLVYLFILFISLIL